jgi:hypothetical protein
LYDFVARRSFAVGLLWSEEAGCRNFPDTDITMPELMCIVEQSSCPLGLSLLALHSLPGAAMARDLFQLEAAPWQLWLAVDRSFTMLQQAAAR